MQKLSGGIKKAPIEKMKDDVLTKLKHTNIKVEDFNISIEHEIKRISQEPYAITLCYYV